MTGIEVMRHTEDASKKQLTSAVDVYVSDWGELQIVPDRFSRARDAYVLDMDYWKLSMFRPFRQWELARTGDSRKYQMLVEFTLEACNEAASGIVADLTTS